MSLLTLSLALLSVAQAPEPASYGPAFPQVAVTVDSSRREVAIRIGPITIAAMPEGMGYGDHYTHHVEGMGLPFRSFPWPVTGWLRGFRLALTDQAGQPLSRQLIHHMAMVNLERRALLQDIAERILAAGQETEDVSLPGSIGLPLTAGTEVGVLAAWANGSGAAIEGAYLTVTITWSPANRSVRPVDVLPLYLDVHYQGVGESNSYDLPPGVSSQSRDFTLPAGGRLLAAGGHMHLHGKDLVLQDLETGRTVLRLKAKVNRNGQPDEVERKLFGVRGDGLRLHAGRRYRITASYDNPTGGVIPSGAMGIMIGLFVPEDLAKWPAVDLTNPGIQADIAAIRSTATQTGSHSHHEQPRP